MLHAATQANHVSSGVTALDTLPAGIGRPVFFQGCDLLFAAQLFFDGLRHVNTPRLIEWFGSLDAVDE